MTESKATCAFFIWLDFESEIGGQEKITTETDDITDGIGDSLIYVVYQYQIDGILNGDGDTTNDSESKELYQFLFLNHFR